MLKVTVQGGGGVRIRPHYFPVIPLRSAPLDRHSFHKPALQSREAGPPTFVGQTASVNGVSRTKGLYLIFTAWP